MKQHISLRTRRAAAAFIGLALPLAIGGCSSSEPLDLPPRLNHWHSDANQKLAQDAVDSFEKFASQTQGMGPALLKNLQTRTGQIQQVNELREAVSEAGWFSQVVDETWDGMRLQVLGQLGAVQPGDYESFKNGNARTKLEKIWNYRLELSIRDRQRRIGAIAAALDALAAANRALVAQDSLQLKQANQSSPAQDCPESGQQQAQDSPQARVTKILETLNGFRQAIIDAGRNEQKNQVTMARATAMQRTLLEAAEGSRDPASAYALVAVIGTGLRPQDMLMLDQYLIELDATLAQLEARLQRAADKPGGAPILGIGLSTAPTGGGTGDNAPGEGPGTAPIDGEDNIALDPWIEALEDLDPEQGKQVAQAWQQFLTAFNQARLSVHAAAVLAAVQNEGAIDTNERWNLLGPPTEAEKVAAQKAEGKAVENLAADRARIALRTKPPGLVEQERLELPPPDPHRDRNMDINTAAGVRLSAEERARWGVIFNTLSHYHAAMKSAGLQAASNTRESVPLPRLLNALQAGRTATHNFKSAAPVEGVKERAPASAPREGLKERATVPTSVDLNALDTEIGVLERKLGKRASGSMTLEHVSPPSPDDTNLNAVTRLMDKVRQTSEYAAVITTLDRHAKLDDKARSLIKRRHGTAAAVESLKTQVAKISTPEIGKKATAPAKTATGGKCSGSSQQVGQAVLKQLLAGDPQLLAIFQEIMSKSSSAKPGAGGAADAGGGANDAAAKTNTKESADAKALEGLVGHLGDVAKDIGQYSDAATQRVATFVKELYQIQLDLDQENLRHSEALHTVALAEIKRWQLLGTINTRYIPREAPKDHAVSRPPVGFIDLSEYRLFATKDQLSALYTPPAPVAGAGSPAGPAKANTLDGRHPAVARSDGIFASFRRLAETAEFWQKGSPAADDVSGLQTLGSNHRLTEGVRLVEGQLLLISINLRLSDQNGLALYTELEEHNLNIDGVISRIHEAGLRVGLQEMLAFHSSGVTEADVETVLGTVRTVLLQRINSKL